MERFARLYDAIDRTTSTNAKVEAMAAYFASAPPADAAWAVFFLTGRRLKRLLPYSSINSWTLAATRLPPWVLEECYAVVGDGAETAALVLDQLPSAPSEDLSLCAMGRGSHPAAQGPGSGGAAAARHHLVALARSAAALHPPQARHRRAARRRLADARRPRARTGRAAARRHARRADHGRVDAIP